MAKRTQSIGRIQTFTLEVAHQNLFNHDLRMQWNRKRIKAF